MAKSNSHLYLDSNKTILYTANNLYKYALEVFNNTNMLKEQQGLTPLAIDGYVTVRSHLIEALLFGKAEAAAALAYMNREGLGIEKNLYQDKLFVSIGNKLGDATCRDLITKRDYSNVEKEATIWVNFINKNKKNLDAEISSINIAYTEGALKTILTNNSIKLDAYNSHVDIIKLDQAETTHTPSVPHHQTTTAYHQPYAKENDPNHFPVKPMGQNADKHSHCDIL